MQSPVFGELVDGFVPVFTEQPPVPWGNSPTPQPLPSPFALGGQRDLAILEALKTLFARALRGVEPHKIESNVESSLRALGIHKAFGLERDHTGALIFSPQHSHDPCDVPLQLREPLCKDVEQLYHKMWGLDDCRGRGNRW